MTGFRADCGNCVGLCCVALTLTRSADFPVDKPAGEPCEHLQSDLRCGIHDRLRDRGYTGCTVYDCFGAGQQVTQNWIGPDWRDAADAGQEMFAVFGVVRQLHELLWLLEFAGSLRAAESLVADLERATSDILAVADAEPAVLAAYDVARLRDQVAPLLRRVSVLARGSCPGTDLDGADLMGRDLTSRTLVGASLRGALLAGADLRGLDLGLADVTGADLRGADLGGTDLRGALFLNQSQVDAARGDTSTRLPDGLRAPAWWAAPQP
ncbi:pentapeptide repeat-containing protein [Nocardioides sp.]|uniref:pentapeptide repeat-containing protein n=1 Tax=Nocardioides sp. TaxID=35761 RepID=UPI003D0AF384